jgi:hypothetical protein
MRRIPMRSLFIVVVGLILAFAGVSPALAQKAQKKETPQSTIKEFLTQHVGKMTNLGTIKRVAGDHFVLEEEGGDTVVHPLSTIHTLRLHKDEETGQMILEIRLTARD